LIGVPKLTNLMLWFQAIVAARVAGSCTLWPQVACAVNRGQVLPGQRRLRWIKARPNGEPYRRAVCLHAHNLRSGTPRGVLCRTGDTP